MQQEPENPRLSTAWREFVEELTTALQLLEEDDFLILSSKRSGHFTQFAMQGNYGLRMEAVSNGYLKGDDRLSRASIEELLALGWCEPSHTSREERGQGRDPDGSPNYFVDWEPPIPFKKAARLAVGTMALIYRVSHPGELQYDCRSLSSEVIRLPSLKLARVPSKPAMSTDPDLKCLVKLSPNRMREVVAQVVAEIVEQDVVEYDKDGALSIRAGDANLLVMPIEEPRLIQFLCPIASDVKNFAEAEEAVNRMNAGRIVGRLYLIRETGAVVYSLETVAEPLVRALLKETLKTVGMAANYLLKQWRSEFGDHSSGR